MAAKKKALAAQATPTTPSQPPVTSKQKRVPDLINLIFGPDSDEDEQSARPVPKKSQSANLSDFSWVKKQVFQEIQIILLNHGFEEDTRNRNVRSVLLFVAIVLGPAGYFLPAEVPFERLVLAMVYVLFALVYLGQWTLAPPKSRVLDTLACSRPGCGLSQGLQIDEVASSMFKPPPESITLSLCPASADAKSTRIKFKVTEVIDELGYVSRSDLEAKMIEGLRQLGFKPA